MSTFSYRKRSPAAAVLVLALALCPCLPARAVGADMPGVAVPEVTLPAAASPGIPEPRPVPPAAVAQPAPPAAPTIKMPAAAQEGAKPQGSASGKTRKNVKKRKTELTQPPPEGRKEAETAAEKPPLTPQAPPTPTEEAARAYARGDHATARRIWQQQAEAGDGQAMNNLGVLHDLGQGVEPDVGRALHWYAQSAKTGHPSGMSNYGRMLEQGRGLEANPEEAARWFDLAARQGQPEAQYNLGMLYELGRGVPKDQAAAAAWYSRAAARHQTDALWRLGHLFRVGQGVSMNASRATLLLYAAAMNGHADAVRELEEMAGEGPPRPEAVLLGQRLDTTDRENMRAALKRSGAKAIRENDNFICDLYAAARVAPGARQLAVCYGPGQPAPLGFLELDYSVPDASTAQQVVRMVTERFGAPSAGEGDDARLWNLGSVVVATRYEPSQGLMSLMYMAPRIYHRTRQD